MQIHKNRIAFALLFGLAFLLGLVLMKSVQSSLVRSTLRLGIDLYPRWIGSQAVLDGHSPYSLETRQRIWLAIYGSANPPQGNPFGFYYPPAVVSLLAPFVRLGLSVDGAALLWCAFLWALWFTSLSLWIAQLPRDRTRQKLITILLLVVGLLFRPAFSSFILGQFSLFCLLMLAGAWLSYQQEAHTLVGVFAALSLVKPSLTVIPLVLFAVLYYRNLKGFLSFVLTSIVLYLPPTLILGWWVPDFLREVSRYTLENEVSWSLADLTTWAGIAWMASSLFLVVLGWRRKDQLLVLSSSLAINALLVPHSGDYDLVAFLGLLCWLGTHWLAARRYAMLAGFGLLMLLLFPWVSLFVFLRSGLPLAVENWYRFIWLVYPVLVLLSAVSAFLSGSMARSILPPRQPSNA